MKTKIDDDVESMITFESMIYKKIVDFMECYEQSQETT